MYEQYFAIHKQALFLPTFSIYLKSDIPLIVFYKIGVKNLSINFSTRSNFTISINFFWIPMVSWSYSLNKKVWWRGSLLKPYMYFSILHGFQIVDSFETASLKVYQNISYEILWQLLLPKEHFLWQSAQVQFYLAHLVLPG